MIFVELELSNIPPNATLQTIEIQIERLLSSLGCKVEVIIDLDNPSKSSLHE